MSLQEVTVETFEAEVYDSTVPVVVDFYAKWCGPCKMMAPMLEQVQSDNDGKVKVVKVDVEDNDELAKQFGIRSVPTLVFLEQDAEVGRKVGSSTRVALVESLNKSFNLQLV